MLQEKGFLKQNSITQCYNQMNHNKWSTKIRYLYSNSNRKNHVLLKSKDSTDRPDQ